MQDATQQSMPFGLSKRTVARIVVACSTLLVALFVRLFCVTQVDNYEIGYKYDWIEGKIEVLEKKGYVFTAPFVVSVHTIDGRPMQVCISAIQRVLNCKLVEFDPKGIDLFLKWHGRGTYTNQGGYPDRPTTFNQILMAYAYDGSGKTYPFLHVIRELKSEETEVVEKPADVQP